MDDLNDTLFKLENDSVYCIEVTEPLTQEKLDRIQKTVNVLFEDRGIQFLLLDKGFRLARVLPKEKVVIQ